MHQEADQIVENIINDHKMGKTTIELGNNEKNHEDLVDVILKVQEVGDGEFRLTTDNMKAVIWAFNTPQSSLPISVLSSASFNTSRPDASLTPPNVTGDNTSDFIQSDVPLSATPAVPFCINLSSNNSSHVPPI
ncbi:hypothetical protein LWI29_022671 [Acer saccharum]|uniref:Uncharacterized protein n=1 Tax=Acer saccharum TaxID=4024 RepID=A0AA39T513_ACESA|nr:hypothetical protein LWI29_022671 [Acer saccharum]